MTDIYFYALKEDILQILCEMQSQRVLKYTLRKFEFTSKPTEWLHGTDLPQIGFSTAADSPNSLTVLISDQGTEITPEPVPQFKGGVRFEFGQRLNPETVTFSPGGLWNDVLIWGYFSTASSHPVSRDLMKLATSSVRKYFVKAAQNQWLGKDALAFCKAGGRLTIAEDAPPEYNLKLPAKLL